MKSAIIFLFGWVVLIMHAVAQPNMVAAEYFFNTDPGPGNGTVISITPGSTIDITNLSVPTTSLPLGWHTLCVRTKDATNTWGFYETRKIYIRDAALQTIPPPSPITAMEYFYDNVSDVGTGQALSITTGTNVDIVGVNLPSSLSLGWHSLHVRTKNQDNVWGFYETRSFFVRSTSSLTIPPPSPITTMEYFYDNVSDPGTGQSISVSTGTAVDIMNNNLTNTLTLGWHTLHVRTKSQDNTWGFYETRSVYLRDAALINNPTPSPIVQFEYFVDNDPGVGQSTLTLTKPSAALIDLPAEPLNVGSLSLGAHSLGLRAKDQNGNWSLTEQRNFSVTTGCALITPPTTTGATRCSAGTLTLTATDALPGQTYRWYTDNTTLVITYTGASFTTPSLSADTDYYVSIYDPATYCESLRTKASAIVSGIPKPILNLSGSLTVCQGNSVTLQAPTGFSSYTWSNGLSTQQITVATSGSYSVIVNNGTCSSVPSDAFTFTVNPNPTKPAISATGGGSLCGTGTVTLSAPAGFSIYRWSSGQSTSSINSTAAGNFSVTVTDANSCESISSDIFSVTSASLTKPIITVTGNTTLCGSGSVQLSAPSGFSGYTWSNGSTTQNISTSSAGNYTVIVSNGGCTSATSDPVVITQVAVASKPAITITGNTLLCNGAFTVLSAPNGFSNYLWSTGEVTRQIVVNSVGSFSVQVGNASTCLSVASDPVAITLTGSPCGVATINPPLVANISRCGAGSLVLTASGASTGQVYRWYDGSTSVPILFTGDTFTTPSLSTTTLYYVSVYDPTTLGESTRAITKASVISIAAPVLPGSSSLSLCEGGSTLLSAPNGFLKYLWSNGVTTQQLQVISAGSYSVQVGDGTCTSPSSNSINVSVVPAINKPVILATGTSICNSGSVQLSAPAGFSYVWSNASSSQVITISTAGNYTVTISNGTCTSPASDAITVTATSVLPKPSITSAGNTSLCTGAFAVLTAPISSNYLWSTGETTRQIVVNMSGNFTVRVGNVPTCLSVASDPVAITMTGQPCTSVIGPAAPTAANNTRCGSGTVTLTSNGAIGNQQYNWYDALTGGNLVFTGSSYITSSLTVTTNFYASIYDPSSALESVRTPVKALVVTLDKPLIGYTGSSSFCIGKNLLLSAPVGFTQYIWSDGSTKQQLLASATGNYSVQVGNGICLSPASDAVKVIVSASPAKPTIDITGSTTFCSQGSVDLAGPSGFSYIWSNGATTQKITISETGVYSLIITTNAGCSSPSSEPIAVTKLLPPCKPNTPPVIASIPISVKIEGSVTVDLVNYITDEENNIDFTRLQLLSSKTAQGATASIDRTSYALTLDYKGILFSGADRITIDVYDLLNAKAQRVLAIDVVGEVVVFNGITPDGDGINDFFYIEYIDVIQGGTKNKVTIFSRWGDVVFEISNYNNVDRVFTGHTSAGGELPPGTYFYRIEFIESKPITGYLTLKQ